MSFLCFFYLVVTGYSNNFETSTRRCCPVAAMESWNHSLKVEAIHGERFNTRDAARQQVFEYIEVYYNRQRLHSTLGYLSPMQFEL